MSPATWERIVREVHPDLEARVEQIQGANELRYIVHYSAPRAEYGGMLTIDPWHLRQEPQASARAEVLKFALGLGIVDRGGHIVETPDVPSILARIDQQNAGLFGARR
jgi:hypothetical protein